MSKGSGKTGYGSKTDPNKKGQLVSPVSARIPSSKSSGVISKTARSPRTR